MYFLKPQERIAIGRIFPYARLIITNRVLIYQQKIYYLYKEKLLPSGVLDMELLTDKDKEDDKFEKEFVNGVFPIEGSD